MKIKHLRLWLLFFSLALTTGAEVKAQNVGPDSEVRNEDELEANLKEQREQYKAILKTVGGQGLDEDPDFQEMMKNGASDPAALMKKLQEVRAKNGKTAPIAGGNIKTADLLNGNASKVVSMMLRQFSHLREADMKSNLLMTSEGKPHGNFMRNNPKFLDFIVKLFKDPVALPQFAKILDQRKKLMYFFAANVGIFIFGFMVKRFQKVRNYEKSFTTGMNQFVIRQLFLLSVRTGVFVGFFHQEAGPLWKLFKTTML